MPRARYDDLDAGLVVAPPPELRTMELPNLVMMLVEAQAMAAHCGCSRCLLKLAIAHAELDRRISRAVQDGDLTITFSIDPDGSLTSLTEGRMA
jgi:hypothetical protein